MAGQNAHTDLKYYETSSIGGYNERQRSFHSAYKLRGESDEQFARNSDSAEPLSTFPLFRKDEYGFRRYYITPAGLPLQTASEQLKSPFPTGNHALWTLKQGFFPAPNSVLPLPRPNDQRSHSSALRPLTLPFGSRHIESRGVVSDTSHSRIGKSRIYATRQYRSSRASPLAILTPGERLAVTNQEVYSNTQELQHLRRLHGNLAMGGIQDTAQVSVQH